MDNRDPATITAKLVAMQNELLQARLQKLAAERGWKLDTEKGQIFMKIPGGEGIQVMRMGEDRDGELVIEGRMLQERQGESGLVPSGPEVLMAPAQSAFARDLLSEPGNKEGQPYTNVRTMYGTKGLSIVATVSAKTTKVNIIDSHENILLTTEVSTDLLKKAIDNLKSQQEDDTKKNIAARLLQTTRNALGLMKNFLGQGIPHN
jgi:hypothetical protein